MENTLKKLQNKLESKPYTSVVQTHTQIYPIYIYNLSDLVDLPAILDYCNQEMLKTPKSKDEKRGLNERLDEVIYAWHSDAKQEEDAPPALTKLFKVVLDKLFDLDKHYTYCVHTFWVNCYQKNGSAVLHNHAVNGELLNLSEHQTGISCVFYPFVEQNCSPLTLLSNDAFIDLPVKSGNLIIFPAEVLHKVREQEYSSKRFSIAINALKKQLHKKPKVDF